MSMALLQGDGFCFGFIEYESQQPMQAGIKVSLFFDVLVSDLFWIYDFLVVFYLRFENGTIPSEIFMTFSWHCHS
jgi:hypothetical protein